MNNIVLKSGNNIIINKGVKQKKWNLFHYNPDHSFANTLSCTLSIDPTSEMTSLTKGVKRSEMICMLAVPAKMTCIELMQFVAPSEWV